MLSNVAALVAEYDMLPRGGAILCAVSGGADSMCLLHYLLSHSGEGGYSVAAAHYNHHLRGAESDRDEAFVRSWCLKNSVPLCTGGGDVKAEAQLRGLGVEEAAREMRYAFLQQAANTAACHCIATAHNADDNAETLLLHLIRGSGLRGLTGIPPRRENLVRPLLTTSREAIEAYLLEHTVPHVEDSTNTDTTYARNKLRHEVMPVLRALNPRLTDGIAATVGLLRRDNDYLNAQAAQAAADARWAEDDLVIRATLLAHQPDPVATRMVRQLLERMGDGSGKCTAAHLTAVVDLARGSDPSAVCSLPDGLMAQRVYEDLLLTTAAYPPPPLPGIPLSADEARTVEVGGWRIALCPARCDVQPKAPDHFFLSRDAIVGQLQVRGRKAGDEITLPLRDTKTVKKLFIDGKIPRLARNTVPILADENGPLALAGFGPDMPHLAAPDEDALEITITAL